MKWFITYLIVVTSTFTNIMLNCSIVALSLWAVERAVRSFNPEFTFKDIDAVAVAIVLVLTGFFTMFRFSKKNEDLGNEKALAHFLGVVITKVAVIGAFVLALWITE